MAPPSPSAEVSGLVRALLTYPWDIFRTLDEHELSSLPSSQSLIPLQRLPILHVPSSHRYSPVLQTTKKYHYRVTFGRRQNAFWYIFWSDWNWNRKVFNYIVNFTCMISRQFRPIFFFYPKLDFNLLDNSLFIEFHVTLHANLLYFILDVDKSYDYFTQKAVTLNAYIYINTKY